MRQIVPVSVMREVAVADQVAGQRAWQAPPPAALPRPAPAAGPATPGAPRPPAHGSSSSDQPSSCLVVPRSSATAGELPISCRQAAGVELHPGPNQQVCMQGGYAAAAPGEAWQESLLCENQCYHSITLAVHVCRAAIHAYWLQQALRLPYH